MSQPVKVGRQLGKGAVALLAALILLFLYLRIFAGKVEQRLRSPAGSFIWRLEPMVLREQRMLIRAVSRSGRGSIRSGM